MEFKSVLDKFEGNLWSYHVIIPAEMALEYILNENDRRVICTLNDKITFQCALMHKGNGDYFINVNKKIREALNLNLGNEVAIKLQKDHSEYGLPMPEEFKETLLQDEEGDKLFHSLSQGKQRTLIYIAGSVKDTQKRINRAIVILTHLKITKGKINFKQLNEMFKIMKD